MPDPLVFVLGEILLDEVVELVGLRSERAVRSGLPSVVLVVTEYFLETSSLGRCVIVAVSSFQSLEVALIWSA